MKFNAVIECRADDSDNSCCHPNCRGYHMWTCTVHKHAPTPRKGDCSRLRLRCAECLVAERRAEKGSPDAP